MSIFHGFDREVAIQFGVEEAIVISHLQYWIIKNKSDGHHEHDGHTWTYKTIRGFTKVFPYWTEKQVRTIMERLVTKGVIMVGHYPTEWTDRTKWYAFVDEAKWLMEPICPNGQFHLPKREESLPKRAEPLPNRANHLVHLNHKLNQSSEDSFAQSAPSAKPTKQTNPDIAVFIDEWCECYSQQFGNRYVVQGGKDGAAVKRLLSSTGKTAKELLNVAILAWACPQDPKRFFWCNKASSIAIFASHWNEILLEADKGGKSAQNQTNQSSIPTGVLEW